MHSPLPFLRVLPLILLLAAVIDAQSRPVPTKVASTRATSTFAPADDRYVSILAAKKLEEGKGFPGVVTLDEQVGKPFELLGAGRMNFERPFWFFYDKGTWHLTICGILVRKLAAGRGGLHVHAIIVAGEGAPPTAKGLKIGDPAFKASQLYGPPQPFDGALVGIESKGRPRKSVMGRGTGDDDHIVDDPPEFKDALFFPAAKLLVAVAQGKVVKLAVVEEEESPAEFLRAADKTAATPLVKIDPSVKVPTESGKKNWFLVPPPPKLTEYKGAEFTAQVPVGATLSDDTWTYPGSAESVSIRAMKGNREESLEGAMFAALLTSGAQNLVPPESRRVNNAFCRMVGATEGWCAITVDRDKGNEGLPLRTYRLLLAKGDRRYELVVTRTQHPPVFEAGSKDAISQGCPDGDALARGVMRGFRITR
jgi:hypothetical protein